MDNRAELENLLNPLPDAFVKAGLVLSNIEQSSSDLAGVTTSFNFSNSISGVKLRLSICDKQLALSAFIIKGMSVYELQEYMKQKKRESEYGSKFFTATVATFLQNLCKLLENEWGDIITGKTWEEIPRDWMGYK